MSGIKQVVRQLKVQRTSAEHQLEKLDLAIKALTSLDGKSARTKGMVRRKPKFTAAGIARIRAAQKARWAKIKAAKK
jgi:hypothetical protein